MPFSTYALSFTRPDFELAEDLTSAIWFKFTRKVNALDCCGVPFDVWLPPASERAYLKTGVRRNFLDHCRSRKEYALEHDVEAGSDTKFGVEVYKSLRNSVLPKLLNSEQLKSLDNLIKFKSYKEIADKTGVPEDRVRKRYSRLFATINASLARRLFRDGHLMQSDLDLFEAKAGSTSLGRWLREHSNIETRHEIDDYNASDDWSNLSKNSKKAWHSLADDRLAAAKIRLFVASYEYLA